MNYVIGYEGRMAEDAPVTWGAAAVQVDDVLLNPVTGRRSPITDAAELERDGHLTRLPTPIPIDDSQLGHPLVCAVLNASSPHAELLAADTGKTHGLVANKRAGGLIVYVFRDRGSFDRYADDIIDSIINRALYPQSEADEASVVELLPIGLILNSSNPYLQALRVVRAGDRRELVKRLALANFRTEEVRSEFEMMLNACLSDQDYVLKYEKGIAEGGGFDVEYAATTFGSLWDIHPKARSEVVQRYSFIDPEMIPSPRFHHMEAQSAELHFKTALPNRSLGDRVARYLELRQIERMLRGEVPPRLRHDTDLGRALDRLANPGPDTILQQKPLESENLENVRPPENMFIEVRAEAWHQFRMLGYFVGLKQEVHALEVKLSADDRYLSLPIDDDGLGGVPAGLDFLQSASGDYFMFRPGTFVLRRSISPLGKPTYRLSEASTLPVGAKRTIDSVPSMVVPGAFLTRISILVERIDDETLKTSVGTVRGVNLGTVPGASAWLRSWNALSYEFELSHAESEDVVWIKPASPPRVTALARVLTALSALDGAARISDLVTEINTRFGVEVRVNNTRREVLRNPDLLAFEGEDEQFVRIKPKGHLHFLIYKRAGGRTGIVGND